MMFLETHSASRNLPEEHNATRIAAKLNARFKEHGSGYQYLNRQFIKVKDTHLHSEVVEPCLQLLGDSRFGVANDEYRKAHEHFLDKRYSECLTECSKSLESTLKVICDARKWAREKTDTASKLIGICLSNNLVPNCLQEQLTQLRLLLGSGSPTLRNHLAAHGAGSSPHVVPASLARFSLHITAAALTLLLESLHEVEEIH